jgi:hypothetical protein
LNFVYHLTIQLLAEDNIPDPDYFSTSVVSRQESVDHFRS